MAKRPPITFRCFIEIDGAEPVPLESVPEEKMQEIREGWSKRIGETLSRYYTQHPDEFENLHL